MNANAEIANHGGHNTWCDLIRKLSLAAAALVCVHSILDRAWEWTLGLAIWILALTVIRRWRWLIAVLAVNPFTVVGIRAAAAYFLGCATLWVGGLPGPRAVDDETRLGICFRGGCMMDGTTEWTNRIHNRTLGACTHLFGIMHGAPQGPFPEESELLTGWNGSEKLRPEDLMAGLVSVNGRRRDIAHPEKLLTLVVPGEMSEELAGVKVRAQDFGSGTFAIRVTGREPPSGKALDAIALYGGSPVRLFCVSEVPDSGGFYSLAFFELRDRKNEEEAGD